MSERSAHEALFLQHLASIDRISAAHARRQGLAGDDAADFCAWVRLKLVEDDYHIVARFRGESLFTTYANMVIARLARDYRIRRWGRWRPSAAARERGAIAIRLEVLIFRQGCTLEQAIETLRTNAETPLSPHELRKLFAALPRRTRMRPIDAGAELLAQVSSAASADASVDTAALDQAHRRARALLERALTALSSEDRALLKLRYWEGSTIADIARSMGLEQKPLYRRVERLLIQLRRRLIADGITKQQFRDLLEEMTS